LIPANRAPYQSKWRLSYARGQGWQRESLGQPSPLMQHHC
jgi:hypothetical protein